jgi:50S ribosomal subunit-associated GTPase HflX
VALHSATLGARPHLVVLTKRDLLADDAAVPSLIAPEARATLVVSAVSGHGIEALTEAMWKLVRELRADDEDDEATAVGGEHHNDDWDLHWGETDPGHD